MRTQRVHPLIILLFFLLLTVAGPAWAAIAEVGGGSQRAAGDSSATSLAVAYPGSVTSGNLLVACGAAYDSGGAPASVSVTDTRSTSYTVLSAASTTGGDDVRIFIAYGVAPSSGANTVTMDPPLLGGPAPGDVMPRAFKPTSEDVSTSDYLRSLPPRDASITQRLDGGGGVVPLHVALPMLLQRTGAQDEADG